MALTNTECFEVTGRCPIHGADLEAQRSAIAVQHSNHRAEVAALQRRIAALESALAVAKATSDAKIIAFRRAPDCPTEPVPEDPAVTPVQPSWPTKPVGSAAGDYSALEPVESAPLGSNPAEVWCGDEVSVQERLAAQAFFDQADTDEPARRWFLKTLE